MKAPLIFSLLLILFRFASGQESIPKEMIEKAAESYEIPAENAVLIEELTENALNPVDINNASMKEIEQIPLLSALENFNLQEYLLTYGEIFSIYELQAIPGFDSVLIKKIEPYIRIKPKSYLPKISLQNLIHYGHQDLMLTYNETVPASAGFLASDSDRLIRPGYSYPGDNAKYSFRYNYSWFGKIKAGISGTKDPGEQFFTGNQPNGMDHYAWYISLKEFAFLHTLVIGNFRAGFGQGLTFSPGYSISSSPGFWVNSATLPGINPSAGTSESSYLRGMAMTLKFGNLRISGLCSYHPRDGTLVENEVTGVPLAFSSFSQSGYHRTTSELARKDAVNELVTGGNIQLTIIPNQLTGFRLGVTSIFSRYSIPMNRSEELYKLFSFSGQQNWVSGIDIYYRYRMIYFFGEVSRSLNGGLAWISGLNATPDPKLSLTIIARKYNPDYQNLYGNAFGQLSGNANETGIFMTLTANPVPKINCTAFFDIFKSPWLHYRADYLTHGMEWGFLAGWTPHRQVSFQFRLTNKTGQNNRSEPDSEKNSQLAESGTTSYRIRIDWNPFQNLVLNTQIDFKEFCSEGLPSQRGVCFTEECKMQLAGVLNSLAFRFTFFDIPTYDTRIYLYEPEVLFGYSVPAYEGFGMRNVAILKFRATRFLNFWLRAGYLWYGDRYSIGSGLDMIKGNKKFDFTGQVVLRL